jgi:hypothetical protein
MYFIFSLGIQPRAHARGLLLFLIKEWHMNSGKTIFAQVMDFLPICEFNKCVNRYQGSHDYRQSQ